MGDRKKQTVELGRRSASVLHRVAGRLEWTARGVDGVLDQIDHIDGRGLSRAWSDVRRPRRRTWRLVAAVAVGALAAVAVRRLWRHLARSGSTSATGLEWHIDRDDGNWQVVDSRQPTPLSTHRTQADAVTAAERSLADQGGGTLVVHALDGHPREAKHVEPASTPARRAAAPSVSTR